MTHRARFRSQHAVRRRRDGPGGNGHGGGNGGGGRGGGGGENGNGNGGGSGGGGGGGGDDDDDDDNDDNNSSTSTSTVKTTAKKQTTTTAAQESTTAVVAETTTVKKTTAAAETTQAASSKTTADAPTATSTTASSDATTADTAAAAASTTEKVTATSTDATQESSATETAGSGSTGGSSTIPAEAASETGSASTGILAAGADSSSASQPTSLTATASASSSTSSASSASGSSSSNSNAGVIAGVVVVLAALFVIGFLMFRFRRKPFMARILAPFRHEPDEEPEPTGPYQNIEKSAVSGMTQPNTEGEKLVAASMMHSQGPNSRGPGSATTGAAAAAAAASTTAAGAASQHHNQNQNLGQAQYQDDRNKNLRANTLTVNTRNLTPATDDSTISPVSSPPSYHRYAATLPAADISPLTISPASKRSRRVSPFHTMSPPPIASPPEPGTAIKVAGSEARIVRIPPRSSRATVSSIGSSSGASRRPGSSRDLVSTPDSGNPSSSWGEYSSNKYAPQQMTVLPLYARPGSTTDPNSGLGYRPYHPSLGDISGSRSRDQYQMSNPNRGSAASGASIASSDIILPDAITWPMPPRTPTTSPDRH